jgi:hypothetical protein
MIDLELALTLKLVRVAREPRAADRRRVLEALRRRIRQSSGAGDAPRKGSGALAIPRARLH